MLVLAHRLRKHMPKVTDESMPSLSPAENAKRDTEADRDFEAGVGIPAEEVFAWLHDRIDGANTTPPKARKI